MTSDDSLSKNHTFHSSLLHGLYKLKLAVFGDDRLSRTPPIRPRGVAFVSADKSRGTPGINAQVLLEQVLVGFGAPGTPERREQWETMNWYRKA